VHFSLPDYHLVLTPDDSDLVSVFPLFVKLWAKDSAKVEYFKTIDGLVCPGMVVLMTKNTADWWITFEKVCGGPI
jgi:hypothetical protein